MFDSTTSINLKCLVKLNYLILPGDAFSKETKYWSHYMARQHNQSIPSMFVSLKNELVVLDTKLVHYDFFSSNFLLSPSSFSTTEIPDLHKAGSEISSTPTFIGFWLFYGSYVTL